MYCVLIVLFPLHFLFTKPLETAVNVLFKHSKWSCRWKHRYVKTSHQHWERLNTLLLNFGSFVVYSSLTALNAKWITLRVATNHTAASCCELHAVQLWPLQTMFEMPGSGNLVHLWYAWVCVCVCVCVCMRFCIGILYLILSMTNSYFHPCEACWWKIPLHLDAHNLKTAQVQY